MEGVLGNTIFGKEATRWGLSHNSEIIFLTALILVGDPALINVSTSLPWIHGLLLWKK